MDRVGAFALVPCPSRDQGEIRSHNKQVTNASAGAEADQFFIDRQHFFAFFEPESGVTCLGELQSFAERRIRATGEVIGQFPGRLTQVLQ